MELANCNDLCDRWDEIRILAAYAFLEGKGLPPFPELDSGLADLRGLVISKFIRNANIVAVDLSGSKFEGFGQFGMCTVDKSRFFYTSLQTNIGRHFSSCDFSSSNLSGCVLRGKFENCDFSGANLSSVRGTEAQFLGCKFEKTNLRKASLIHCLFEDCKFQNCRFANGSLAFSKFKNTKIPETDLGNTLIEKVVSI